MKRLIDEHLLEKIRTEPPLRTWIFNNYKVHPEIVPETLQHQNLIRNNEIANEIELYYYSHTKRNLSENEFLGWKELGYIGNKETALPPYSDQIFNAFYSRTDLHAKLSGIIYRAKKFPPLVISGKEIKCLEDLIPYFIDYSRGFKCGYDEFEEKQIKIFLTPFADKTDYVQKVFEYLTKQIPFSHGWSNCVCGFRQKGGLNEPAEIIGGFKDGIEQGYYYRAWTIVFSNNKMFAPLFRRHYEDLLPQQTEKKSKPDPEHEIPTFANKFDKIKPTEIYQHFKIGLVEKGYLTEQELNEYLKVAFELKAIPSTRFKIKDAPTKQKVMKVFYDYYKNIAGKPHGKQNQYAALLGDYFEGYNTQNVSSNFNK